MNKLDERGGVGGVQLGKNNTHPSPPTPLPNFVVQQREKALRTVREATTEEIACVFSGGVRATIFRVQSGWVPERDSAWIAVLTAASFIDHSPTEQGQEARQNRFLLVARIVKAHERLVDPPPVVLERERGETADEFDLRLQHHELFEEADEPDPALVAEHAQHCAVYPWITFYLGYRTSPVTVAGAAAPEEPRPVRPPRDRFTVVSVRKARERARDRGTPIDPRWAASAQVMYLDVVAEIGTCPPMVDADGQRVYTLDRHPGPKLGYRPGNVRWADKSQQRDNRPAPRRTP